MKAEIVTNPNLVTTYVKIKRLELFTTKSFRAVCTTEESKYSFLLCLGFFGFSIRKEA